VTSTADPLRPAAHPSWLRTGLLVLLLAMFSLQSPPPWSGLWLMVPVAVTASLLAAWRFGPWGVLVPVLLFAAVMVAEGPQSLWVWWIPATALTGSWMGLREEGGGPAAGPRAWMLLPVLLLAAAMPWMVRYPELVKHLEREFVRGDQEFLDLAREFGARGERMVAIQRGVEENAKLRTQALPYLLPSAVFAWMALLVNAGRTIAGRIAGTLKWPALSRASLTRFRLPDGAVWLFLAGLALLVVQWGTATSAAWTLMLNAGLGFCIQGIAVVESLLLARGVPPSVIVVTMAFVFALATPVFMLTTVAVGLSDVWLDFRRMETPPDTETT
jgi:hypothetical protein